MIRIWRKLLIQWKLLLLFTITVVLSMAAILLVVQNIIVKQLNARQQEKITFAKNSVTSALDNSRRMAVNYLTLVSRDDAIKDSFYYAVRAREVANLEEEFRMLSPSIDYDLLIARDTAGDPLVELGRVPGVTGMPHEPLKCESDAPLPGKACDELWKWHDTLLLGAVAPVYKSRLAVEYRQTLTDRDLLGSIIIASALNDDFAEKIRETTGTDVVIRSGETVYATSLPELRKSGFGFTQDASAVDGGFSTKEIAGISYLTASLPLTAKDGQTLGELVILADNQAIAGTTQRIYFTITMASVVILMLGITLAFAFARDIGLSIQKLSDGAEKIGRGDFDEKLEVKSYVELDYLARSFNSMSRNLKSLITEKENHLEEIRLQHEKIIEQKEYMASLFENANDLIYVADLDGKVTFVNQKIEEYGFSKEELLGRSIHEFLVFRDRGNGNGRHSGRDRTVYEVELHPIAGPVRLMIFSSSLIKENSGAVTSELCILRDITEIRKLEDNMNHFDRLACTGRLAAGLAHEIGNPLTSISSFLQLLAKKEHDDFTEDCISTIQKQVLRICLTVDRLKNLSRPHSFEKWSTVDIDTVIKSAVEIIRFDPRLVDIEIDIKKEKNVPNVTVQGDQIMQVLINLVLNGADAIKDAGKILLRADLDRERDEVFVEIIDTGAGIRKEHLDQIFDPFFTTKGPEKGTGLGLYVCQCIIQHHGGRIIVKSVPGEGTSVSVYLPIAEKPDSVLLGQQAM